MLLLEYYKVEVKLDQDVVIYIENYLFVDDELCNLLCNYDRIALANLHTNAENFFIIDLDMIAKINKNLSRIKMTDCELFYNILQKIKPNDKLVMEHIYLLDKYIQHDMIKFFTKTSLFDSR